MAWTPGSPGMEVPVLDGLLDEVLVALGLAEDVGGTAPGMARTLGTWR